MRIRPLRQEFGMTQEELGKKIGQTKSNISKYETGSLEPSIQTLNLLADIFNVSVDYLLGRSDERKPDESDYEIVTQAFHLSEDVSELSPEEIEQIDDYIRFIKSKNKK
ncbi:MAG: helix-turn-helix domain-containing protein [Tissierellales bacterium]|jgi:transcriptional regulator with XRE-family HTH domain|nr:helix-turn-helix domain-containing protein [Tissierellales bacterium]